MCNHIEIFYCCSLFMVIRTLRLTQQKNIISTPIKGNKLQQIKLHITSAKISIFHHEIKKKKAKTTYG